MVPVEKVRLDQLLVEQGWTDTRERAKRLVMAGVVWCRGQRLDKPGVRLALDTPLEVQEDPCPWVSRGALKLIGAIDALNVDPAGQICADIGASTGGFTEVLLDRGAERVHAIDVGRHQLHQRLREDSRVSSRERLNARDLTEESLPERVTLITVDASFISLTLLLEPIGRIAAPDAQVLALVKPQFEAGRDQVRGGVVNDPAVHRDVLTRVGRAATDLRWSWRGACPSPLRGPAGNREHFVLWQLDGFATSPPEGWAEVCVGQAFES